FDFPMVGMNQDAVTITGNIFTGFCSTCGYVSTDMFSIAKARLYNGLGFSVPLFSGLGGTTATPIVLDQSSHQFLLTPASRTTFPKWDLNDANYPGSTTLSPSTITVPSWSAPPLAPQGGSSKLIDTSDGRVSSDTFQTGSELWAVHTVALGSFSAPKYYLFNT